MRRLFLIAITVVAVLCLAFYILAFWPLRNPHPAVTLAHGALAIRDARVYVSPDDPPLDHVTVVVRDGRIIAVGSEVEVPMEARLVECAHCTITAGFWNTHVHFTEPKWQLSEWKSADVLNAQLADMLTSRGFTTVVDTSSNLRDTIPLRRRIETGDVVGPQIYTAGMGQYPPHGIPFYIREHMPRIIQTLIAQPETPIEAANIEEHNIAQGADILKLFTGSYVERDKILPMPVANAAAAVAVAHRHGQIAYSHPSNLDGVLVALHSGVDVLAHAPDTPDGIDTKVLRSLVEAHMTMIPTLKMFATTVTTKPAYLDPIYDEVRQFHALGGQLMFGTDVGYMTDYSTRDEFEALQKSGLGAMDVLRMLTTVPAARFGVSSEKGRVAVGQLADLVVLKGDPATDIAAFSNVDATIRGGRVIYSRR